jgi:hypothetical protein
MASFNKINDISDSSPKILGHSNAINSGEKEKRKKRDQQKITA